jgi:hypothetical protein
VLINGVDITTLSVRRMRPLAPARADDLPGPVRVAGRAVPGPADRRGTLAGPQDRRHPRGAARTWSRRRWCGPSWSRRRPTWSGTRTSSPAGSGSGSRSRPASSSSRSCCSPTSPSRCSTCRCAPACSRSSTGCVSGGTMGIVMITHDLSTAAHFADRIAVMYLGRIVEEGAASDVIRTPAASVHQGVALDRAAAGSPGAQQGHDPGRRDAEPAQHPDRLPVPPALPHRAGPVPRDRSGAGAPPAR